MLLSEEVRYYTPIIIWTSSKFAAKTYACAHQARLVFWGNHEYIYDQSLNYMCDIDKILNHIMHQETSMSSDRLTDGTMRCSSRMLTIAWKHLTRAGVCPTRDLEIRLAWRWSCNLVLIHRGRYIDRTCTARFVSAVNHWRCVQWRIENLVTHYLQLVAACMRAQCQ